MKTGERKIGRASLFVLFSFGMLFLLSFFYFLLRGSLPSAAISLLFFLILLLLYPAAVLLHLHLPAAFHALILSLCFGSLLGSCFNFYFRIPFWDLLLHVLAGWLFAAAGYAICTLLFPKQQNSQTLSYLVFGVLFSLSIGLLWELFEAGATVLLPVDMQEDTLVYSIKSFFLSGTHGHTTVLSDITRTEIHYGNGQSLSIEGYLDLGLKDTLGDMAVCLLGNLLFLLLFPIDRLLGGRLLPRLLPRKKE